MGLAVRDLCITKVGLAMEDISRLDVLRLGATSSVINLFGKEDLTQWRSPPDFFIPFLDRPVRSYHTLVSNHHLRRATRPIDACSSPTKA